MSVNLDKSDEGNVDDAVDPFFAIFKNWDGSEDTPIGDSQYAYQTTMTVYDEAGSAHELTIYFDKVDDDSVTSVITSYSIHYTKLYELPAVA